MRAIASILALIGFALSGCSIPRHYWYNPDKSLSMARQDCRECYNEAVQQASEDAADEYYRQSPEMREAPYYSTRTKGSEALDLGPLWYSTVWNHRENLFRGCMKSRGYFLTREDELGRTVRKSSLRAGRVAGE